MNNVLDLVRKINRYREMVDVLVDLKAKSSRPLTINDVILYIENEVDVAKLQLEKELKGQ